MNELYFGIFQFAVLIFSAIIHEVAHGLAALRLGDTTARDSGRLTLNPIRHLDPFGSVILPLLLMLSGSPFLFGWAKPVPYNPYNLKNPKQGGGIIALAGPISNLVIAGIFSIVLRVVIIPLGAGALILPISSIIFINILLAVFNLMPLPPLDGSNILFAVLPKRLYPIQHFLNRYGFWLLIIFVLSGAQQILTPILTLLYHFFVGPAALF
jgi:Zn-dependent protease